MISINQTTVRFGGFELFSQISMMISPRDRIGLVGKNGAGKSTLMKIILGEEMPDEGSVTVPSNVKIGYLPQQMIYPVGKSVFEETMTAFDEVLQIETQIKQITAQLSEREDYSSPEYIKLIDKLTTANERYDLLGGSSIDADVEQTLTGLGFRRSDFDRQTNQLSGGWRMRIELAKVLLRKPSVFLLDEPTNHLDIESIQWLEDFLKEYAGAVVLISHDRAFLDNVTKRTVEISVGKLYDYDVSYTKFVELRKERRQQQMAAYENQQKMIQETEKFIERFRYKATKAVQVQSRIKHLDKVERIQVDKEDTSAVSFKFPAAPRSGTIVVETKGLTKRYGETLVLDNVDFIIERGEKLAFVGRNGEGKTTLSRIITETTDYEGVLKIGHNVNVGYYAQNEDELMDLEKTVFETIDDIAVGEIRKRVRDILGSFLFSGETIDKKVKVLSGGECSRLAMAKLLLEPYSLLLLDEPTNHLDMRSKDLLKQALNQYDGTLIVVSHDRDFLDGLVDKIYEFRDHKLKQHSGGIYNFLKKRKLETLQEIERKERKKGQQTETTSENKQNYLQRKEFEREKRKYKNRVSQSETRITKIETEIEQFDNQLAQPNASDLTPDFFDKYKKLKKQLENEMETWENLSAELDDFIQQKNV